MQYRTFDKTVYIRIDKGEEIVGSILDICKKEKINSAVFSGIGGCGAAEIQTFLPESGTFETHALSGMLELVSLNGSVTTDEADALCHHTHAAFAYKENGAHRMTGGHLKSAVVLYTAEIELRPVVGGVIRRKHDPETGTGFWDLCDR